MPHVQQWSRVHIHHARQAAVASNVTVTASGSQNTYVAGIINHAHETTIALAVVVAVLAVLVIIGTFLWRWRARKQRNQQKSTINVQANSTTFLPEKPVALVTNEVEKPKAVYNVEPPVPFQEGSTGWAPQIKEYRGVLVSGKQYEKNMTSSKARAKWEKALVKEPAKGNIQIPGPQMTPPPAYGYHITNGTASPLSNLQEKLKSQWSPITPAAPPTPPMTPADTNTQTLTVPATISEPLQSPARTASFAHQQFPAGSSSSSQANYRVMTVVTTFVRSLDDELAITVGETVHMLEEYQDGWCLCQTAGAADAPQGVVPRFCLVEKKVTSPTGRSLTNPQRL